VRYFFYSVDTRPRAWHIVQRQVTIQTFQAQTALNFRMDQNCLQLRAKKQVFSEARDVKGLNSHPVSRQNKPTGRFRPYSKGKHSPQSGEAVRAPFDESAKNCFCIAMGAKSMAAAL